MKKPTSAVYLSCITAGLVAGLLSLPSGAAATTTPLCTAPAWNSTAIYTGGDEVTYSSHTWTAKWWTQNEAPSTGGSGVWQDDGACTATTTSPSPTNSTSPSPTPSPSSSPSPSPTPSPSTSATPSGNAVVNGDLEFGALSPWTCQPGSGVVTSPVHAGTYALKVAPTSSQTGECDQTISVAANTSYTLTAWVQGNYAYVGVSGGASASTWTSSSAWTQLSVPFTTGSSGNVTVFVHGWYSEGNVYADDVAVSGPGITTSPSSSPSPSPSSTGSGTNGTVTGVVRLYGGAVDTNGNSQYNGQPGPGMTVTASQNNQTIASTTTDSNGVYTFVLPAGAYTLTECGVGTSVQIEANATTTKDLACPLP